ncbi:TPA: hypothetical protein ACKPYC_001437 [Pseudomonas aeruginosa]|uniref:hypothetical protein n=1 Tax=Pseudomonas aeruginosa TaxID=287 RepID=UPI000940E63A|nr:hypothetical protein [Pseudomonas aeruginosa]AYW42610.1 hypothetical protein DL351_25495 [Pseudomonas aeruginosa]KAB0787678.1 hypothetical protein F7O87_11575 [Pseudomonas aeruginosa]MBG6737898.1 hypothetical protein [Pseudomonas aeruginosa]MBH3790324.1 hypothetical protein [Pseudomonas aeruginosa]MBV5632494.1 hypothetical protein [Pseudomonas aeruginosa]
MDKKAMYAAAALAAAFIGPAGACPLQECMPSLSEAPFQSRDLDDFGGLYDLKQPGQAVLHVGLIAADYRIALLEAENRALRAALTGSRALDDSSLKFFPSPASFMDAMNSDMKQVNVTGRMPQLRHFEQRVRNAETRAKLTDAGRALGSESTRIAAETSAE